ncbi:MAG: 4-(cytidine 5'-diphospho)-2-C-methyl-D-erythritol kinase [Daejeonella sp.]
MQKSADVYKMITFPNAKINIGLNILNRRNDAYHNLETVFYPVGINDALEIIEADELKFTSSGSAIPGKGDDNLCLKAYKLLAKDADLPPVHIHLHKHIPIGAGLGGGSADAAFCIKLLNDQFTLGLGLEQLEGYARQLGADCAFFIKNKPVYAFEKGDRFKSIKLDLSPYFIVVLMPGVQVSTEQAYRDVKPSNSNPSLYDLVNLPVESWKDEITNDFESSVFEIHPQIAAIKSGLYQAGAIYASMSGSGSAVYAIFKQEVVLPELEKDNRVFYGV